MKKTFLFLVLLLVFAFMPNVYAKEANVTIKSIEKVDVTGKAEEVSEATISNGTLNFNLLFLDVGDSVKYKVVVENNDSEDYSLVINSDDEYVVYLVENNTIKKNTTSEVTLIAKYNKEVPVEQKGHQITKTVKVNVSDGKGNILNPKTGRSILFIVLLLLVLVISSLIIKNKKVKSLVLLLEVALLPTGVSALNSLVLTINTTYTISDGYVYTLSYTQNTEESVTRIGETIPDEFDIYNSSTEAKNAWKEKTYDGKTRPFYLKHKLNSDGVVEESYVVFEITDELLKDNSGVVLGTYSVRAFRAPDSCANNYSDSCISPYYNGIVEMLNSSFGENYMFGNSDLYWNTTNLFVDPDDNGYIWIADSDNNTMSYYCGASGNGITFCYYYDNSQPVETVQ